MGPSTAAPPSRSAAKPFRVIGGLQSWPPSAISQIHQTFRPTSVRICPWCRVAGAELKLASFRETTAGELRRAKALGAARAAAAQAIAVGYDDARDRLTLEFDSGFGVAVSLRSFSGFQHATADDLQEIEILGSGGALHFPRIDQSLSIANLLAELMEPLRAAANRRTRPQSQPPIRVQGGYLPTPSGEQPPPPPKGGSSFRRPKT